MMLLFESGGRYRTEELAATSALLVSAQGRSLVEKIANSNPPGWAGPPAPLVYFVVRSDAVDVVYGTPEGFDKLGVPYMQHIMPPRKW